MKGMIFLDKDFKSVKLPEGKNVTKEEFKNFIHQVYYAYFDIPERMKWFVRTYRDFDEMNSIFMKQYQPGGIVYSYDQDADYWCTERDLRIRFRVFKIYNNLNNVEEDKE